MWTLVYSPIWKERACNYGYANMKAMRALLVPARFVCWLSAQEGERNERRETDGEKEKENAAQYHH